MIEARCEGNLVRVFEKDLSEQSECIEIESDPENLMSKL